MIFLLSARDLRF